MDQNSIQCILWTKIVHSVSYGWKYCIKPQMQICKREWQKNELSIKWMGILFTICKKLLPLKTGMDGRQEQVARLLPDMILLIMGFTTRAWCTATLTVSPSSLCLLYITEELLAISVHVLTDRGKHANVDNSSNASWFSVFAVSTRTLLDLDGSVTLLRGLFGEESWGRTCWGPSTFTGISEKSELLIKDQECKSCIPSPHALVSEQKGCLEDGRYTEMLFQGRCHQHWGEVSTNQSKEKEYGWSGTSEHFLSLWEC